MPKPILTTPKIPHLQKFLGFLVILLFGIAGAVYAFLTVDLSQYRQPTALELTRFLGRSVTLNGPMHLRLTHQGLSLEIQDVTIANPSWAHQKDMATFQRLDLIVQPWTLFQNQLVITALMAEGVDVDLEATQDNLHNWDFAPQDHTDEPARLVALETNLFILTNSRITVHTPKGETLAVLVDGLGLKHGTQTSEILFNGQFADHRINLRLDGDNDFTSTAQPTTFSGDLRVDTYRLLADGKISLSDHKAMINSYNISAGDSYLNGAMAVDWGTPHPQFVGSVTSSHFNTDELLPLTLLSAWSPSPPTPSHREPRFFSERPFNFDWLKQINAELDINLENATFYNVPFNQLDTRILLADGRLFLSPIKILMGDGSITGQFNLDTSLPQPHLGLTASATDIDLGDLFQAGGISRLIDGKADGDLNFVTEGNNPHALASNLSGSFNLLSAGGDVLSRTSDKISDSIAAMLNGGHRNSHPLNCLIARFTVAHGLVRDNGMLFDTSVATVVGGGGFDLRGEVIDLLFRAKVKEGADEVLPLVHLGGSILELAPLHIGGTFLDPSYGIGTEGLTATIESLFDGNTLNDPIPDVVTIQGQNACLTAINRSGQPPHRDYETDDTTKGFIQKSLEAATRFIKGLVGQ